MTDVNREAALLEALRFNTCAATYCALLLMEDGVPFSDVDFFTAVAGISYEGNVVLCLFVDTL